MITQHNFEPDIDFSNALGIMMQIKPTADFEGGTILIKPHTQGLPSHYHPQQAELFNVIQGELEVLKNKQWIRLKEGDRILIPQRVLHSYRNVSDEIAVFDFALTPKIGISYLLFTLDELIKSGKITGRTDMRSRLHLSKVMASYPNIVQQGKFRQLVHRFMTFIATTLGMSIEQEKFRAEFLRPVKLWQRRYAKPEEISDDMLEELLF